MPKWREARACLAVAAGVPPAGGLGDPPDPPHSSPPRTPSRRDAACPRTRDACRHASSQIITGNAARAATRERFLVGAESLFGDHRDRSPTATHPAPGGGRAPTAAETFRQNLQHLKSSPLFVGGASSPAKHTQADARGSRSSRPQKARKTTAEYRTRNEEGRCGGRVLAVAGVGDPGGPVPRRAIIETYATQKPASPMPTTVRP